MRLDLFLKASRLISRRSIAQMLCDAGLVTINGSVAKSSRTVRVGDQITFRRHNKLLTVRVLNVPVTKQTSKSVASMLYEVIVETEIPEDSLVGWEPQGFGDT